VKRNIFISLGNSPQLTEFATDTEVQHPLRVDEEINDKLAMRLPRQVACERSWLTR
jgi:hypothetical protein